MDTFLRFKLPLQRKGDNFRNDLRIKSRTHRCSPYFACTAGVCIKIKPDYKYRCNLLKTQHSSESECNPEEHTHIDTIKNHDCWKPDRKSGKPGSRSALGQGRPRCHRGQGRWEEPAVLHQHRHEADHEAKLWQVAINMLDATKTVSTVNIYRCTIY